jgi:hypothetical protein
MVRLFRRRAATDGKGGSRARPFIRMLALAALAISSALTPFPKSELCLHPMSYEIAKSCPERRQEYLDSKPTWKGECIRKITYDPKGRISSKMSRLELAKHGLKPTDSEGDRASICKSAAAHVYGDKRLVGRGEKADVFVCDKAFKLDNEEEIRITLAVHEGKHACDRRFGVSAGEKLFTYRELADVPDEVFHAVVEVRAYGASVKEVKEIMPYDVMSLKIFALILMAQEVGADPATFNLGIGMKLNPFLDEILSRVDSKGTASQYLIRHTLAEHKEKLRKIFRIHDRVVDDFKGLSQRMKELEGR